MKDLKALLAASINESKKVKKYYHASVEDLDKVNDFPMFTYDDLEESKALVQNCADEGRNATIYVIEPIDGFKVLPCDEAMDILDDDLLADIVCNPSGDELKKMVEDIEKTINSGDNKYHAIEISDYSQKNFQEDAISTLFLHPVESVKSFKKL